jgi:hypothetical protein
VINAINIFNVQCTYAKIHLTMRSLTHNDAEGSTRMIINEFTHNNDGKCLHTMVYIDFSNSIWCRRFKVKDTKTVAQLLDDRAWNITDPASVPRGKFGHMSTGICYKAKMHVDIRHKRVKFCRSMTKTALRGGRRVDFGIFTDDIVQSTLNSV